MPRSICRRRRRFAAIEKQEITMETLSRRNLLTAGAALVVAPLPLAAKAAPRRAASPAVHFDAVGDVVLDAVNTGDVPGAISVIWQDGAVQCVHRAGTRDISTHAPIGMDTLMGIASMSKPVTVAAALTLVEQGVMKLEDPITRWAPEFANMRVLKRPDGPLDDTYPAPRLITIEDLMT